VGFDANKNSSGDSSQKNAGKKFQGKSAASAIRLTALIEGESLAKHRGTDLFERAGLG